MTMKMAETSSDNEQDTALRGQAVVVIVHGAPEAPIVGEDRGRR